MRDAFRNAYPPDRSLPAKILLPAVQPRTFLRALHLGLMFPVGIAYFVVLVTAFAIGGALIWTIVGPVVLLITLYLTRWAGDAEAWTIRRVSSIELRRPPTAIERGQSFREQVKTRLIDPTTWTGLGYLLLQFPIGIGAFMLLVVGGVFSGVMIGAPFYLEFADRWTDQVEPVDFDLFNRSFVMTEASEALVLVPLGLLAYLALVHLVIASSALHASWARLMLGSRARAAGQISPPPGTADRPPDGGSPQAPSAPDGEAGPAPVSAIVPDAVPATAPDAVPAIVDAAPRLTAVAVPLGSSTLALETLTPREREVLALIARGYSNATIAETFVISEGTVKTHVKRVLAKLELQNRTQAAIYAYETGFVTVASGDAAPPGTVVPAQIPPDRPEMRSVR